MPNGGSDCCGTCWFNRKNKGQAGYAHAGSPEPAFCTVRDLPIESAFYTYCANHPHHRPQRDPFPIGPVFTGNPLGEREFWQASPDSEEIRLHLLDLLSGIEQQPSTEYPVGICVDEIVIWQLGEFREPRALEGLRRVAGFDPLAAAFGPFGRDRQSAVRLAREALAKIEQLSG